MELAVNSHIFAMGNNYHVERKTKSGQVKAMETELAPEREKHFLALLTVYFRLATKP